MSDVLEGLAGRSAIHITEREFVLALLPQKGRVLEVGTLDGATVRWWAEQRPDARFVSLDCFRAATGTGPGNPAHWFENAGPNQCLFGGTLDQAAGVLADGGYDVVFIDGDHSYEGCLSDCRNAVKYLKPGATLCVHDYGRVTLPHLIGVTTAVDEFCEEAGYRVRVVGRTVAVLEKVE